jgi:hypothetical protein
MTSLQLLDVLSSIKAQRSQPDRLSAYWIGEATQWTATAASAGDRRQVSLALSVAARIESGLTMSE